MLYVLPAPRFKTVHLLLSFQLILDRDTVTRGALLPRVLRRGTRRYPDMASLAGHLEDLYGASLGTSSSKMGDRHVIEAAFSFPGPAALDLAGAPASERETLPEEGVTLLTEVFADPAHPGRAADPSPAPAGLSLRPDYVTEEKDSLARDIAALSDDRMTYSHYRCIAEMCQGEPNALLSLGQAEDIPGISPEDLDGFRRELIESAPLVAHLAGPPDENLLATVKDGLKRFVAGVSGPGPRREVRASRVHERPNREKEVFEQADVEQARLVIGLQTGVVLADPLCPAQILYNGLLGGFVHSRLFKRVREEAGLAYYAWSRLLSTKGVIMISCGIQEKNYKQAMDLIRQELASLGKGDFTDDEFEATRNSILAGAKSHLDSPSALIYGHLERLSAGEDPDEIAPWRRLEGVTADDVREYGSRPVIDTIYLLGRSKGGA